jgi:hypothetical protein
VAVARHRPLRAEASRAVAGALANRTRSSGVTPTGLFTSLKQQGFGCRGRVKTTGGMGVLVVRSMRHKLGALRRRH